jgi:DNA polymerase
VSERDDILGALRHLLELERASGVEFVGRGEPLPPPAPRTARVAEAPAPVVTTGGPWGRAPSGETSASDVVGAAVSSSSQSAVSSPTEVEPRTTNPVSRTVSSGLPATDLAAIAAEIRVCQACKLCPTRINTVPGEGNPAPELLFVGEGPGADEDAQGRPFVGAAGQLLDKMIVAMGFTREQVFIANVVKCRPPGNRTPEPDEVAACMPFLERQILALRPRIICSLGNVPLRALMNDPSLGITRMRGKKLDWRGIPLIPTFHPSYLLRNPSAKKPCWEDLQIVLKELGRTPPVRK